MHDVGVAEAGPQRLEGDLGEVPVARALAATSRFHMMTLNNESDELNAYRIREFGLASIFEAFISSCYLSVRKPFRRRDLLAALTSVLVEKGILSPSEAAS